MENAPGTARCAAEMHVSRGRQRLLYPSACALNPSCTVALLSTVAGVRAYELITASEQREGAVVRPLHPDPPPIVAASPEHHHPRSPGTTDAAAPPPALWRTPVFTATLAGDSSLVAVVFRTPPLVFVPSTITVTEKGEVNSHQSGATPLTGCRSSGDCAAPANVSASSDDDDEEQDDLLAPAANSADAPALEAADAECRRYVYLFDATTGTCLTALHFCGSPVLTLRANLSVLLVAAVDLFHLVDIRTLRYIRQQSMFKPLNRRGVLDLSASVPSQMTSGGTTYAVAFPQSARGYSGDVTVLTLHSPPPKSGRQTRTGEWGAQAPGAPTSAEDASTSCDTNPATAANPTSTSTCAAATPPMQQRTIPAHHHSVAHLRFRPDGRLLATTSERGTTVKLFDSATGALLVELQRGHRPAAVLSLAVQQDAHRIAALSANGTLHVFDCAAAVQSWEVSRDASVSSPVSGRGAWSPRTVGGAAASSKVRADSKHKVILMSRPTPSASAVPPKSTPRRLGSALTSTAAVASRANCAASHAEGNNFVPAAGAAVNDGWLSCESGFAADGQTVWVVQMQSTEAQLQRAVSTEPSASSLPPPRLSVGSLKCFPLPPPNRGRSGGAVSPSEMGSEGCHHVLV
ncbi:hypothetical protein JKF63_00511 [Porcisia hertigi]|uniref:WD repeat domain phosphoinositide-interacting protein 2 n=1 Tax=Porcisia hertigi TaxID=2761500 RepID=A0A836I524_9TRYP|nr:hypothetical protein JKF63_00511 [Porcisia hertigi]